MIIIESDLRKIFEHAEYIQEPEVQNVYFYMVGRAAFSKKYRCEATPQGDLKNFKIHNETMQPFSFAIYRNYITFYFRNVYINDDPGARGRILESFPDKKKDGTPIIKKPNSSNDHTIRIEKLDLAKRVMDFIENAATGTG